MKIWKKINKGLILTIIVVTLLIIYLNGIEKERNANKPDIKTACEKFIEFYNKNSVLPEEMQKLEVEPSKEEKEKLNEKIKTELKKLMIDNEDAIDLQYQYLVSSLEDEYKSEQIRTKVNKKIQKISSYEFDGDQVTVEVNTETETTYKYFNYLTNKEEERKENLTGYSDEIILQKVNGEWKIVYASFVDYNNYIDDTIML